MKPFLFLTAFMVFLLAGTGKSARDGIKRHVLTVKGGSYSPNAWGFYDMHGNVWERCRDWYGDYPSGSVTDPVGDSEGTDNVLRGGWDSKSLMCRSAYRFNNDTGDPSRPFDFIGLRLSLVSETKSQRNGRFP
ncbi:MAG: formylglycine-generating enzyme family protein [Planctomycetaceae bacterium]|nr:formylglycine-generating enzyme family protein [Planctomycetaceae bacterium]